MKVTDADANKYYGAVTSHKDEYRCIEVLRAEVHRARTDIKYWAEFNTIGGHTITLHNRIRELEEDLEIAIDERNGLIDSVMKMYSDNTRLREAIEARDTFIKELRRRAGITTTENNQEGDAGNQKE
jgi:hypothetical protein